MSYRYFIISVLLIFYVSSASFGQTSIKVKATGYGKTERDALEEARRNAVFQGIDELFADKPQQKEVIKDKITNKPEAYIKNEEILTKEFDDDTKMWEIKIKAVVSRSDIEKDLGAIGKLLERLNRPKILVISTFYQGENPLKKLTDLAVNTINEYLGRLGFTYVSQNAIAEIMQGLGNYSGAQSFQDIAMKSNAPYYISVNITRTEFGRGAGDAFYSSVNVNLEAFDSENATGVGTTNQLSGKVGSSISQEEANFLATKEASILTAEEITQQILIHFNRIAEIGSQYEIRVYGINDYLIARDFKDALTNHKGFSGDIRMSKTDEYYRFELSYKSPRPDEVVDAIFDALTSKVTFRKLNLKSATGKLINFENK